MEAAKAAADTKVQAEAKVAEAEAALSAAQRVKAEKDQNAASGPAPSAVEAMTKEAREAAAAVRRAESASDNAKDLLESCSPPAEEDSR